MIDRAAIYPLVSKNKLRELLGRSFAELQLFANSVGQQYEPFDTRDQGAGKWRHIDNPVPMLKGLQRTILQKILRTAPLPPNTYGAITGHDIRSHVATHAGNGTIAIVDLRDCFPRTHYTRVYEMFESVFGATPPIATLLTKLTTYQCRVPQGAPTSSYLVQLCLKSMLEELHLVASCYGLKFSCFVDDIAWSGPRVRAAFEPMIHTIQAHGQRLRCKKKKLISSRGEHLMNGVAIRNGVMTAHSDYILDVRKEIVSLVQRDALTRSEFDSLQGRIRWVALLDPSTGRALGEEARALPPCTAAPGRKIRPERRSCRCTRRHVRRPAA